MLFSLYSFSLRIVFASCSSYIRRFIRSLLVLRWYCLRIVAIIGSYCLGLGLYCMCIVVVFHSFCNRVVSVLYPMLFIVSAYCTCFDSVSY